MKREILFKGKLSHSKEWIEGNLIIDKNLNMYIIPFKKFKNNGYHLIIDSNYKYLVDKDSVCQFINHRDKNGKKIFEGDYDADGNCIVWCQECNGFEFSGIDSETKEQYLSCHRCDGNFFFQDHINNFEIIGNIAD